MIQIILTNIRAVKLPQYFLKCVDCSFLFILYQSQITFVSDHTEFRKISNATNF